jgi:DNA-directed RNA polymerase specialized sigma24 family protein
MNKARVLVIDRTREIRRLLDGVTRGKTPVEIIECDGIDEAAGLCAASKPGVIMVHPALFDTIIAEYRNFKTDRANIKEIFKVMMRLSPAEFEVIKAAGRGYSYKQIAEERGVEETTVRTEIFRILKKFSKRRMKDVISQLNGINFFDIFEPPSADAATARKPAEKANPK